MLFIPGHIQPGKTLSPAKLPFTAVYQDNIRNLVLFYRFTIATAQDLIHRRIIIARRDAGNIVAPILRAAARCCQTPRRKPPSVHPSYG
jgi:hypothetical protein